MSQFNFSRCDDNKWENWVQGRLSRIRASVRTHTLYCFLIKEKKGRKKEENERKRIKGDPWCLQYCGIHLGLWVKRKLLKEPNQKGNWQSHNVRSGEWLGSSTVYMHTESSGSTKEGTGKVRSRRSYGSKRKRGEQSDRAPVDLPKDTDQQVQSVHPANGRMSGSYTSHRWKKVAWLSELYSSNKYPPSAHLVINALSTVLKAAVA